MPGPASTDITLLDGELRLAGRLDARFFALLAAIEATGSLNRGARVAGYSYRGAWLLLEAAGRLASSPLVQSATGGMRGGGSQLTPVARGLLDAWRQVQQRHRDFLAQEEAWLLTQPAIASALRRLTMKTTARNQFIGQISAVAPGPVTTQVSLALAGGQEITATMTTAAAQRLKVKKGQEAIALIDATALVLVVDFAGYALSARNQLAGTISRIETGAVTAMVGLTLPGGATVTAAVANDAVSALGLAVGQPATAVFKAYSVMVAVAVA